MKITSSYKIFSLLIMLLLSSCLSTVSETTCGEGEAYDAEDRTCVPTIAEGPNTIFVSSSSPSSSAYVTNLTSSSINHSITVSNQYNNDFSLRWTIYSGVTSTIVSLSNSTFTLDPSSLINEGNYILEAGIYSPDGTDLYDSKTWNITVEGLTSPTLTNTSPAINIATYAENAGDQTLSADILNPDAISGDYRIVIDGDEAGATAGTFTSATSDISTMINPETLEVGIHSLEIQLINSSTTARYDSYAWTINIIEPDLPQIDVSSTSPSLLLAISVIDGISFQDTSASPANQLLSGFRDSNGDAINEFCVVVDNSDKDGDGSPDIYLDFEINGNKQGSSGTFAGGSNTYCHESFNIQSLVNSDVSESRTLVIKSRIVGSNDLVETVQYDISVRPRNLRPLITIASTATAGTVPCSTQNSTVLYEDCEMEQSSDDNLDNDYTSLSDTNNSKDFSIAFNVDSDPDLDISDPAQYNVYYQIKSVDTPTFEILDGTSTLSNTNCDASSLTCSINIDAFNDSGNIPPGTYTVQAYLEDVGSIWEVVQTPKASNTVSWVVEVSELQSTNSISIANQGGDTPGVNESWIENTGVDCSTSGPVANATNSIAENNFMKVHTFVKDHERDNFKISMTITNSVNTGFSQVLSNTTVNRTDDSEYLEVESCFRVPQYVISNAVNGSAILNVSVTDIPDDAGSTPQGTTNSFDLLVDNFNPVPSFDDNSTIDLSTLTSIAGFPFYLDAQMYSDLSTTDGDNVIYKWQASNDNSTWEDIPNANSTDQASSQLIWTAPPTFSGTMSFRLCLGDDGFGNDTDCSIAAATKIYENLNVLASQQELASIPEGSTLDNDKDNIATWFDETNQNLYTVYSVSFDLFVTKQSLSTDGELVLEHEISFKTESTTDFSRSSDTPETLSITGTDDGNSLLIAYTMLDDIDPANPEKRLRVRRLDISNGKLTYKYGGFFNGELDTLDQISSITNVGLTFNTIGDGDMRIDVSAVTSNDGFTITTASSSTTLTVGNGVGELCETTCANPQTLAANIASFINNHADTEISQELNAVHTTGSTFLTIQGSNVEDYYNGTTAMPYIGDISVRSDNMWLVPFIDINNNSTLNVIRANGANNSINGTTPATSAIATGQFNKSVKGKVVDGTSYVMASINTNNNVDIYRVNSSFTLQSNTIVDAFNLGTFIVSEIDLDIGYDTSELAEFIYVAAKLEDTSTLETKVGAIMSTSDLDSSTYIATDTFLETSVATTNIQHVKLSASQQNKGEATLATITTTGLYVTKIGHPLESGTYSSDIVLEVSDDTAYVSPALSTSILTDSSLAMTKAFSTTLGHISEGSDSAVPDVTREIFFLNSIEDDGASNFIFNINRINTQAEDIMTNSDSATNSYPAQIKN